tara:strand:- start:5869 stop:10632 length:4764 start_codon:yes stop_codon:yes gene_type:complete
MADTAYLGIEVDSSGLKRGERDLDTFATKGKQAGDKVSKSTGLMTKGFNSVKNSIVTTLLAVAGIGAVIVTLSDFETSVSKMGAVSRATTVELAAMRDVAKDLGSTTEFSATQAGDGLTFLAMAGFSAAESMAALPAVLDLATASGMGLAAAADTASNIMSGFGVAAEHAADVADLLAAASSRANTDVTQLGDAMKFVGPVASALGIEMSDAAAAIGVLSDAGIQGGMAGTSLRQVLSGLVNPTGAAATAIQGLGLTVEGVSPQTNTLVDIIGKFSEAGVTAADAMTILGDRGGPALLALTSQSNSLRELTGELSDVEGEAARMAETFRDNLRGDIQGAISAAQGLIIALGDAGLTAILRGVITFVTELTRHITNLVNGFSNFTSMIRNLFSFAAAEERVAAASEAVNVAIEEQVKQHDALNIALGEGKTVSIDYAGALLANARATLASTSATRELRIEEIKRTEAYSDLVEKQIDANRLVTDLQNLFNGNPVSEELQRMADTSLQVNGNLNGMLELYQSTLVKLQANTAEQNLLTGQVDDTSEATVILENQIRLIEAAIAGSLDGTVRFGAELEDADQTAGQLAITAAGVASQLSVAAQFALNLANNLAAAPQGLEGFEQKARQLTAQISALDAGLGQVAASSAGYRVELEARFGLATAANAAEETYISGVINREVAAFENVNNLNNAYSDRVTALNSVTTASGSASGATTDTTTALERQINALEDAANPLRVYTRGMAELDEMKLLGLSDGAYAAAVEELSETLENATGSASEFADTFSNGVEESIDYMISGMKNGMEGLLDIFKNTVISMVKYALMNPINMQGGMNVAGGSGGGMGSALMGGASAAMTGGGSLMGIGGGLMGGVGAGVGMAGSALMSGGLSGMTGAITAQVGAATAAGASMTAMGAAIGAIALPVAAVAAVFLAFRKTSKDLETGLRFTVKGIDDTLVENYTKVRTSQFFGLSKDVNDVFTKMNDVKADPLQNAVRELQQDVLDAAGVLNIGAEAFDGFSRTVTLSTKDMSADEAQRVLQAELFNTQQAFSDMIPTLTDFKIEGESTTGTLARLISNLGTVNESLYLFDQAALEMSLASAGASSELIILSGGLEAFASKTQFVFANMLTDIEQQSRLTEISTDKLNGTFGALGIVIPETHAEFMALLNVQDLLTVGGRNTHAALLDVAGAFVQVYGTAENAVNALSGLSAFMDNHYQELNDARDLAQQGFDDAQKNLEAAFSREMEMTRESFAVKIDGLKESLSGARERLANSRAIAEALADALDSRVFPSVEAQRLSQDRAASYLQSLVGKPITDVDALQSALKAVANPSENTYKTLEEYTRDFNITSGVISELQRTAGFALSVEEQTVSLLEQQISDTEAQSDAAVSLLQKQLDSLLGIEAGFETLAASMAAFQSASAALASATAAAKAGPSTAAGQQYAGTAMSANWSNEQWYLANNPDVLTAVADGRFTSAADHFQQFGKDEGRAFGGVPSYAVGTDYHPGGLAYVHKDEMINMPQGSSVSTVSQTSRMFDNSEMVAELRNLRQEVEQLSAISLGTNRNTLVSAKLAEKQDAIGTAKTVSGDAILVKVVT